MTDEQRVLHIPCDAPHKVFRGVYYRYVHATVALGAVQATTSCFAIEIRLEIDSAHGHLL